MKVINTNPTVVTAAMLLAGIAALSTIHANASTVKPQPVPRDSFLRFRVDTVQQLISQIKADPAVQHRYCQLLNVAPSDLVSYVQKNVVESYVPATRTYRCWCVSKTGKLYAINARFTAGTRVFALRNGTPVMKWACGNPVVTSLPDPPAHPRIQGMLTGVPAGSALIASSVVPDEQSAVIPSEAPMALIPTEMSSQVPQTKVASSVEQIGASRASGNLSSWLPLAGVAALFSGGGGSVSGSGSGHSGGTISGSGGSRNGSGNMTGSGRGTPAVDPVPVTPEPDPAVTLLFGLIPLAGFVMYARRPSAGSIRFRS